MILLSKGEEKLFMCRENDSLTGITENAKAYSGLIQNNSFAKILRSDTNSTSLFPNLSIIQNLPKKPEIIQKSKPRSP